MEKNGEKSNISKYVTTVIVVLGNVLLWVIPSNVAYLVAQNRDVLLGRYGETRFTWMLLLIPVSIAALYLTWSNEKNERQRQFKVIAISVSIIISVLAVDVFARLINPKRYVKQEHYYHRVPNTIDHGAFQDVPEKAFAYPVMRPGYPDIEYTLTVDKRGFRNKTDLEEYDLVILGDSFAEGSGVSDDQVLAVLLAQKAGQTVYNLGMAAGHPGKYLETLKRFVRELSPRVVICLLFEGNDFRDDNFEREDTFGRRLSNYFKSSPIRLSLENLLICYFGASQTISQASIGQDGDDKGFSCPAESLSWMPVAIPDGPDARYYTFQVKKLLALFVERDDFLKSEGCQKTFESLQQIKKICNENNIRFIVAYDPDKPHVLLPLIKDKITSEQLHAFMALGKRNLPPVKELMDEVFARLDVQESAVEEFCRQQSIEFVSLTEPLRQKISEGQQAYFTYDQHWTPIGHEVAANTLYQYLQGKK
jgi:hypothetical protein